MLPFLMNWLSGDVGIDAGCLLKMDAHYRESDVQLFTRAAASCPIGANATIDSWYSKLKPVIWWHQ
jgi:hypothetical protein